MNRVLQPSPLIVLGLNVWMGTATGADELVEIPTFATAGGLEPERKRELEREREREREKMGKRGLLNGPIRPCDPLYRRLDLI
jgi:hypothetical protein